MMVSMGTTTATITFEEFERMPEQPGKQELLRGELIELPPADANHNEIALQIYERLKAALQAAHAREESRELNKVHHEMGYRLAGSGYLQPDISVTHADQTRSKYFEGAPAIAIEVVSPSNSAEDLETKSELYFEFGAREVWLVYPKARHIIVRLKASARVIAANESLTTPLLPGFELSVSDILPQA